MTTPPTSASAPPRPLSPALDTTFKIGLVLKGLDGIRAAEILALAAPAPRRPCPARRGER